MDAWIDCFKAAVSGPGGFLKIWLKQEWNSNVLLRMALSLLVRCSLKNVRKVAEASCKAIIPDYNKDVKEVYRDATVYFLTTEKSARTYIRK